MDINYYTMYRDPMMTSRSDTNAENSHQWSHDVYNGRDMQWQQSYEIQRGDEYNMRAHVPHEVRQPLVPVPAPSATRYSPMRSIPCNQEYPIDPMSLASYPRMDSRPINTRPMDRRPMYPRDGYSYGQPPVLRQLHSSNEQLSTGPEIHREMHQDMGTRQQFDLPPAQSHRGPPSVIMSPDTRLSPAKTSRAGSVADPPRPPAFEMSCNKPPAKRPFKTDPSTPSARQKKKMDSEISPSKGETDASHRKEIIPADSPDKENKPAKLKSRCGNTRFISASVADVVRWRKHNFFSDVERSNLVIEIVGTVFDVSGKEPIKISLQSQETMSGIFWETDFRLDKNVMLPGCLVRVVLRIPEHGKDFHFLKVSPLVGPAGTESAFRRISYVTTTAIEQATKKS